ncbi:hypothetical protein GNI_177310 [Gregarina niphandrodes]|uniref:Calponin-homology (CH) domain-containing protein n=1 Tax=Gregarina niphandrodes TaxID=110365 RepID=A0A023AX46_GRENI|nr:hypothetical protein GNI_177310 [Gregarina niphandrodes]EZG43306.1 hypothetical protein GNI_177310 [Gregarina niphandrodes]|eukprot:XP_011133435.1 hypothetical protein GNI_177310 [Gregarina niphandrodes]
MVETKVEPKVNQSRRELLEWLQQDFKCGICRIEECGNGSIYLQILDRLYPGTVPMHKINWSATAEYEVIKHYKILQDVLKGIGLSRGFDIDGLARGKYQDNLEFLQWLRAVYDKKLPKSPPEYDPEARRKLSSHPLPAWIKQKNKSSAASTVASRKLVKKEPSALPPVDPVFPHHHLTSHLPPHVNTQQYALYESKPAYSRQRLFKHLFCPNTLPMQILGKVPSNIPTHLPPLWNASWAPFALDKLKAISAVCQATDDSQFVDKAILEYIL